MRAVSDGNIEIDLTAPGFARPKQNAAISARTEALIEDICPGVTLVMDAGNRKDHPLWGPYLTTNVGHSTDPELRHHASSGGALSALLIHLLETKNVDYAVQISASEDSPIENAIVESLGRNDVYGAAGSRYAPSAPLQALDDYLDRPGRFAIVGKPCDIAAVRALGRHDPRVGEKVSALISFFCAGVPSLEGTRQILNKLGVSESDVSAFNYRGDGWPGEARALLHDGSEARMNYASSWGGILSKHVQFRCKICPDGTGGFADVVFGDAWHCDKDGYPLFAEENGRSLIVVRTDVGNSIVAEAVGSGHLAVQPIDVAEIESMQPSQARRKRLVLSRLYALISVGRSVPRFRGLKLDTAARSAGLWPNLRSYLGMLRRLVMRKT